MTSETYAAQLANVRQLYESGQSITQIAAALGLSVMAAQRRVHESGATIRSQSEAVALSKLGNHSDIAPAVLAAYGAGQSVKKIAAQFGVSRNVIARLLKLADITPRNRSESMLLRQAQSSPEERRALAAAAHATTRGKPPSPTHAHKLALTNQRTLGKVGMGEEEMIAWLTEAGLEAVPQLAVGPYNIDVAIHPVAVEIVTQPNNPHHVPRLGKRAEYLAKLGWFVLYVKLSKRHPLTRGAAQQAIAFREAVQGNPAACSQYRVIRGSGEMVAEGRLD